jgi:hypothetical protein
MNVLIDNNFLTDKDIVVSSLSYAYRQDLNSFIESSFTIDSENFPNRNLLKVKILYSNNELETPDFSEAEEFRLVNLLKGNTIAFKTQTKLPVDNLYVYLYIFNDTGSLLTTYEKVFVEELTESGEVVSGNFVDLRIENAIANIQQSLDEKETLSNRFNQSKQDLIKQNYISNLYYSVKEDNKINLFFGIDQEQYFIDNNFIGFLKDDPDFNNYLSNNNFITQISGQVYNNKDLFQIDPTTSKVDLNYLLGTLQEAVFQVAGTAYRTENYGYRVNCFLKNAITEFALNNLRPVLVDESNFLNKINLRENEFQYVPKTTLEKTLMSLKGLLKDSGVALDGNFTIFDESERILLSTDLVKYLLDVNEIIIKFLVRVVAVQRTRGNNLVELQRDFGKIIDTSLIKNVADVHGFGLGEDSLTVVTVDQFRQRATQELQKYFDDATTTTVDTKDGITEANLSSLSLGYLTSLTQVVNNRQALSNEKGVFYNYSVDDFLAYISAIDTMVSEKLSYDFKISNVPVLDTVTSTEFDVEQRSEQVSSILNSLTVVTIPELRTEQQRRTFLSKKANSIKTFEVPSTLRTDLCVDDVTQSDPRNDKLTPSRTTPEKFIGNNVLAFSVLTNLKSFTDKSFYEFYKYLQNNDINTTTSPIQTIFLKKYYDGDISELGYLEEDNLFSNFVVYGLIYFLFKSIFKVSVYIPDVDEFVVLSDEVLSQLKTGQNYLCLVDNYTDAKAGVATPEMLRTSIYNRYFVLEV